MPTPSQRQSIENVPTTPAEAYLAVAIGDMPDRVAELSVPIRYDGLRAVLLADELYGALDAARKRGLPLQIHLSNAALKAVIPAAPPGTYSFFGNRVAVSEGRVHLDGNPVRLTPTEYEIVAYLGLNPGIVHTRRALEKRMREAFPDRPQTYAFARHIRGIREVLGQEAIIHHPGSTYFSGYSAAE